MSRVRESMEEKFLGRIYSISRVGEFLISCLTELFVEIGFNLGKGRTEARMRPT